MDVKVNRRIRFTFFLTSVIPLFSLFLSFKLRRHLVSKRIDPNRFIAWLYVWFAIVVNFLSFGLIFRLIHGIPGRVLVPSEGYTPIPVNLLSTLLVLFFSVILHEVFHGYCAYLCGDPTAHIAGRLSFNPVSHIDPIGSILLPLFLILTKVPFLFGWAKPVPIQPANFRDPARDQMLVSVAGVAGNFALALTGIAIMMTAGTFVPLFWPTATIPGLYSLMAPASATGVPFSSVWATGVLIVQKLILVNLVLGYFNLLPIPPLDGSWLLMGLKPRTFAPVMVHIRKYGMFILLFLFVTGLISVLFVPLRIFLYALSWIIGIGVDYV